MSSGDEKNVQLDFEEGDELFGDLGFGDDFMFDSSEFNITGEDLMLSSTMTWRDLEADPLVEPLSAVGEEMQLVDLNPMGLEPGDRDFKMEDMKFTVTSETPGTSEMEDVKLTVLTSEIPGSSKMQDKKLTVANQSTDSAKVKVGVKGRGRPKSKAKNEVDDLLKLRPPRKLKQRPSQVPEEKKTTEYYELRRKNTEAARKCREKKRGVDEKRVDIIKRQDQRIKELTERVQALAKEKKLYKDVIDKFAQTGQIL